MWYLLLRRAFLYYSPSSLVLSLIIFISFLLSFLRNYSTNEIFIVRAKEFIPFSLKLPKASIIRKVIEKSKEQSFHFVSQNTVIVSWLTTCPTILDCQPSSWMLNFSRLCPLVPCLSGSNRISELLFLLLCFSENKAQYYIILYYSIV